MAKPARGKGDTSNSNVSPLLLALIVNGQFTAKLTLTTAVISFSIVDVS